MKSKVVVFVVVMLSLSLSLSFGTAMALEFEPMAFQYLRSGTTDIGPGSNGSIYVYGNTLAKQVVNRVEVTIILQQYKNGAWVDYWSDRVVRHEATSATAEKMVSVQGGYQYRLYGIHNVTHNNVSETTYTLTGSWYVN
ncbi:MAG: hypothetical protein KGZ63_07540 [Clostridiales bacterium]|nr:hypothetical protein [Clostridiales bacterium]